MSVKRALALLLVAGCPGPSGNPPELWLGGDANNELITYLVDHEPTPY